MKLKPGDLCGCWGFRAPEPRRNWVAWRGEEFGESVDVTHIVELDPSWLVTVLELKVSMAKVLTPKGIAFAYLKDLERVTEDEEDKDG